MTRDPARRFACACGTVITATFLAIAVLSLIWTPYDPSAIAIVDRLQPPSAHHWLGTDQFGRDLASMLMAGARSSVSVALVSVLVGFGVGLPLGLLAAARGGLLDAAIMRGCDVLFAFPALLLAVLLTAALGPGAFAAILAIGLFNIPVFARVTRGSALGVWTRDFCLAAQVSGKGPLRISIEHVAPNLITVLAVQVTIQFSLGVIAEAGLSYLGLGVQPPQPSWGRMLEDAQTLTALDPALALYPGCAVTLFVVGLNLLGLGLQSRRAR